MSKTHSFFICLALLFQLYDSDAQSRVEIPFNGNWQFTGGSVTGEPVRKTVHLPHTWNARDAQEGISYYRGDGTYEKTFTPEESWKGKRIFIRFNGVMTIARVFLNGRQIGEHRGGYAAFVMELTDKLKFGEQNTIKVTVNNEATLEVLPLFGDFNLYGGIYRPVNLIITSPICISPMDFAAPGVYLKQTNVSHASAGLEVMTKVSSALKNDETVHISTTITTPGGTILFNRDEQVQIRPGGQTFSTHFTIQKPHLWNGREDPALYTVSVKLIQKGRTIDSKTETLGLRYFSKDPDQGFFLNGRHIPLHGVSRHQDRQDKGSALSCEDHKQDMEIMLDMGINALRLAHYQQSETIYDLCDSAGIIVWAELPWVGGPGGFLGQTNGYEPTEAFHRNAKQQLTELIRQNYNHPSIAMWCIFNEIQNPDDESPVAFIEELNQLAKTEDPSRLTVGASMLDPEEPIHDITDLIAWNRYFGWYYDNPEDIGPFLDKTHKTYPGLCIGISEYGAGASVLQHDQKLKRPNPFGSPHPEEWQSYYHEKHIEAFNSRPFVWGTFVWNMFDFGSHFRREGDHYGINDKGLVTFDRKIKKDAYFLYKANWTKKPFVHITSKRQIFRYDEKTPVKVYTNLPEVTLTVNGKAIGTRTTENGIARWEDVVLVQGNNSIKAEGTGNGQTRTDYCVWVLDTGFGTRKIAQIYDVLQHINLMLFTGLLLILIMWYLSWKKIPKLSKWNRIAAKTFFFVFLLAETALLLIKIFIGSRLG